MVWIEYKEFPSTPHSASPNAHKMLTMTIEKTNFLNEVPEHPIGPCLKTHILKGPVVTLQLNLKDFFESHQDENQRWLRVCRNCIELWERQFPFLREALESPMRGLKAQWKPIKRRCFFFFFPYSFEIKNELNILTKKRGGGRGVGKEDMNPNTNSVWVTASVASLCRTMLSCFSWRLEMVRRKLLTLLANTRQLERVKVHIGSLSPSPGLVY